MVDTLQQPKPKPFGEWIKGSATLDERGHPIRLYRGLRRRSKDGRMVTTCGRGTLSFTRRAAIANVYARQLPSYEYGPASNVVPVYLAMRNPLDLRHLGQSITLYDLVDSLPFQKCLGQDPEAGQFGYFDLAHAISGFDGLAYRTNARFEIEATDAEGMYRVRDFNELSDCILEHGAAEDIDALNDLLEAVTFDAFLVGDSKNWRNLLYRIGYDGVIHIDAFDIGVRLLDPDESDIDSLNGETYRPFRMSQVRSSLDPDRPF